MKHLNGQQPRLTGRRQVAAARAVCVILSFLAVALRRTGTGEGDEAWLAERTLSAHGSWVRPPARPPRQVSKQA